MSDLFLQGLMITGLGMGLVFIMIVALWGIMVLLVRLTNQEKPIPTSQEVLEKQDIPEPTTPNDNKKRAAAAAVAYALSFRRETDKFTGNAAQTQSQWTSVGKLQQTLKHSSRERRP